jgi:hypothetical protein
VTLGNPKHEIRNPKRTGEETMAMQAADNSKSDARPAELRYPPEGTFKGLCMGMDAEPSGSAAGPADSDDLRPVRGETEPVPMRTAGEPK